MKKHFASKLAAGYKKIVLFYIVVNKKKRRMYSSGERRTHSGELFFITTFAPLMRGTLDGCILKIIDLKTTYGYEIVMQLEELGFTEVKEGIALLEDFKTVWGQVSDTVNCIMMLEARCDEE